MFSILSGKLIRPQLFRAVNRSSRVFQSTVQKPVPKKGQKKASGLKGLMQEYGYSALGVYLAIGLIDLPICYLLVSFAGEEKIGEYEEKVKKFLGFGKHDNDAEGQDGAGSGEHHHTSFWTTLAIAYGIHKSLIFIRLPIAAAVTPSVVSKLRKMGFNIGNNQLKTFAEVAKDSYKEHGLRKSVSSKGVKNIMHNSKMTPKDATPISNVNEPVLNATDKRFGTPPSKRQKWYSWFF